MISIFDPTICSYNIGNEIIMDAVIDVVNELFPSFHIVRIPCTDINRKARHYNVYSKFSFVGGTNILNNNILRNGQWDMNIHNLVILKNIILMGCGWFQYEKSEISKLTKWGLRNILSKKYLHSVRDSYTQKKLVTIGIDSINTGCPTLWKLTPEVIQKISKNPKREVVVTITDYNRNAKRDLAMLKACEEIYPGEIYFFPQGTGDLTYLKELGYIKKVHVLTPRLAALDEILSEGKVDYIGTRLHAGVRSLQHSVRAFIIGVDNRALEMEKDFNLPVLHVEDAQYWKQKIGDDYSINLRIPSQEIKRWKGQFV